MEDNLNNDDFLHNSTRNCNCQGSGDTNRDLLVAQDKTLTIYANDVGLNGGSVTPRTGGKIGFFVSQESGETVCGFSNGWIWELKE